jgi:hypothetical protein
MERHFSTGVATIVQLMAANRAASARADVQFGAGEEIHLMRTLKLICWRNMPCRAMSSVTGCCIWLDPSSPEGHQRRSSPGAGTEPKLPGHSQLMF